MRRCFCARSSTRGRGPSRRRSGCSSAHDGARPLAGGQTLVNVMKARAASPDVLVDLQRPRRAARRSRDLGNGSVEIGAMTTYSQLDAVDRGRGRALDPRRGRGDDRRRPGAEPRHDRRQRLLERPDEPPAAAPRRARRDVDDRRRRTASATVPADEFFLGVYMTAAGPGRAADEDHDPAAAGQRRLRGGDDRQGRHGHRHRRRVARTAATRDRARLRRRGAGARARWSERIGSDFSDERVRAAAEGLGATLDPPSRRARLGRLPAAPRRGRSRRAPSSAARERR